MEVVGGAGEDPATRLVGTMEHLVEHLHYTIIY